MTLIKEFTAKKMQLWFAGGALLMYLVYMAISLFTGLSDTPIFSDFWNMRLLNRAILLLPYLVLFGAALISSKLKGNIRYIPYLLVGMELVLSMLGRFDLMNYHPVGIFEGAGWIGYDLLCSIIFMLLNFVFLAMPFAKKPTLIVYSGIVTIVYMLAMGLEIYYDIAYYDWGFQIDVIFKFIAVILYQLSFVWFAFEMTTENRIHIYSRIFDFFVGLDFLDDDDYSDLLDEIEEELSNSQQKYDIYALDEGFDSDVDENASRERWIKSFDDLTLKTFDTLEIDGSDFLLDPLEQTGVTYKLERNEEHELTVSGRFSHSFSEEQAARILRKKSVLNRTFKDIEIEAKADADMGVEFVEEGKFFIQLKKKTFDVSNNNYDAIREYLIRFLEIIIVIQNTESYE